MKRLTPGRPSCPSHRFLVSSEPPLWASITWYHLFASQFELNSCKVYNIFTYFLRDSGDGHPTGVFQRILSVQSLQRHVRPSWLSLNHPGCPGGAIADLRSTAKLHRCQMMPHDKWYLNDMIYLLFVNIRIFNLFIHCIDYINYINQQNGWTWHRQNLYRISWDGIIWTGTSFKSRNPKKAGYASPVNWSI